MRVLLHVIVTTLLLLWASGAARPQEAPLPTIAEHQPPQALGLPIRLLEDPKEKLDEQRDAKAAAQREKDDLVAQQSVADSTKQLVYLTVAQVILGLVGTAALAITLYLNARATQAAVQAAQSERAWIIADGFDSGQFSGTVNNLPTKAGFIVEVKWRNAGRSPSINTQCYSIYALLKPEDSLPTFTPDWLENEQKQAAVGPSNGFSGSPMALNDMEAVQFRSGERRLIIYSKVIYGDIFQSREHRSSEVCAEVHLNGEKMINGSPQPNVAFMPVGPQNSVS